MSLAFVGVIDFNRWSQELDEVWTLVQGVKILVNVFAVRIVGFVYAVVPWFRLVLFELQ